MALTKLVIYSSLIFLVWIIIPPDCSAKSLNTTTTPEPQNTTTLDPTWYMSDEEFIDYMLRQFDRNNSILISADGEIPEVYFNTKTNTTWKLFPREPEEKPFFRRLAEFVSENIFVITAVCLPLIFVCFMFAILQHFVTRLNEEDEFGQLINVNVPKMAHV